jgi:putative alpha-1,2-mannosidase
MKKTFFFSLLLLFIISCSEPDSVTPAHKANPLISYVNPFIGTGGHGHTYPGATMPFGMMQLSPDTRLDGWDGCSGYHYSDEYIYGFSHTHLSGTGVSDYGDILLMPTSKLVFNNGADGKEGYRAPFSHANETASPGYYKVLLDSTNINVELTVTERAGMHKYTYPSSENQHLILDLEHRDMILDLNVNEISKYEVSGYRFS